MAEKKNKQAPKRKSSRVVDKWKLKSWYNIKAPETFEGKELGQLISSDEANLKNRIIRIGLGEITGSFTSGTAYTSVLFRVTDVSGKQVSTKYIGHELAPSYIKTLLRRRRSIIYNVDNVKTTDGHVLCVKSVAVTAFKVSEAVRKDLRAAISQNVKTLGGEMTLNALVQDVVFGKFSAKIFGKVKNLTPMRRMEIRKSELVENFK